MLKFDSVSIGYHKVPLIKNLSVEIPTGSITTIVKLKWLWQNNADFRIK